MNYNGTTVKLTWDFLNNFKKNGLNIKNIRVRLYHRNSSSFVTYPTLDEFYLTFSTIINSRNYSKYSGSYVEVQNMTLTNTNFKLPSTMICWDIHNSKRTIVSNPYDVNRNSTYELQMNKYIDLQTTLVKSYQQTISSTIEAQQSLYMDANYVDDNYTE